MRLKWLLTVAGLKMFFREKEAVFWTLFLPLFMVVLFGFVKFDQFGTIQLGLTDLSHGKNEELMTALRQIKTFRIHDGTEESERKALEKGERDLVLVIPESLQPGQPLPLYWNEAKPQEGKVGELIVQQIFDDIALQSLPGVKRIQVKLQGVKSRKLTYMDFLLPGIMAMSIMQMGIFSVAFVFVDLKKRGVLRRLKVTPMKPVDFIFAHVITRLVVLLLQATVLIGTGLLFFNLNFTGNPWNLFVVGVLGAIVFLAMGFSIAGVSKSEDQVAPLANVIVLPMMLLSGIFFSRANLPGFAHWITGWFPLTFLADAIRSIAIDGASLKDVIWQILGLGLWGFASVFAAIKLFRWE